MEQIRRFLREKGFALALIACLLAAAAAGVWAVRTVRDELKKNLDNARDPASVAPGIDEGVKMNHEEESEWQQETTEAANSTADIPKPASSAIAPQTGSRASSGSSGGASGSGSVREPSALHTESAPASSSPAAASVSPALGRVLNGFSGDELVYNKTLGDWRTHNGIDYAAEKGAALSAPVAGKIVTAGTDGNWGPVVEIEDASGRLWRLCGVEASKVKAGDTVEAGQALGKLGTVGCECAEESHLHLEIKQGTTYLDPAKFVR